MKYTQGKYPLICKKNLAQNIYSYTIYCPEIAKITHAGQFAQVKVPEKFLRRPISICESDSEKGTIRIVFITKGEGTENLAKINEGETVDILAPLGHGFDILPNKENKKVILVGGGIGVPPMVELAKIYGKNATAISGFRSANLVILQEDLKSYGAENIICTDDGTQGIHGFVTEPLEEKLKSEKIDIVYSCGPMPMLKNIAKICDKYNTDCEVSLEQRMGCGIGACLGCATDIKSADGKIYAKHVCKDGPVFNSKEVVW